MRVVVIPLQGVVLTVLGYLGALICFVPHFNHLRMDSPHQFFHRNGKWMHDDARWTNKKVTTKDG